jgi:tetratricopeptide (TPR) repeat protein
MARIQRQELKHDEFIDSFDEFLLYLEDHWQWLTALVAGLMLVGGALGGFYFYSQRQERAATAALGNALESFEAPVRQGLPPTPGDTERSFATDKEKYETAAKEFAAVRTDFPRTRAALHAKHYEALCRYRLGETEAATKSLEDLSRAADRNVAALARLNLAGIYESQDKPKEAEALYRQLTENPAPVVPREVALLALADLLTQSNPAEARRIYEQIKGEFPDTPVAEQVTRRLDLLPPPAPPTPTTPPFNPPGPDPSPN